MDRQLLWRKLKQLRYENWYKVKYVSMMTWVSECYISQIERWESNAKIDILEEICKLYNFNLEELCK